MAQAYESNKNRGFHFTETAIRFFYIKFKKNQTAASKC